MKTFQEKVLVQKKSVFSKQGRHPNFQYESFELVMHLDSSTKVIIALITTFNKCMLDLNTLDAIH